MNLNVQLGFLFFVLFAFSLVYGKRHFAVKSPSSSDPLKSIVDELLTRPPPLPPYRASICLLTAYEERILPQWIVYHILLGFDHFWIYDNSPTARKNPQTPQYKPFIDRGYVTHIDWSNPQNSQEAMLEDCMGGRYADLTEWLGCWDTDEYLVFEGQSPILTLDGSQLQRFLRSYVHNKCSGIHLDRLIFGTSGHISPPLDNPLIIQSYTWYLKSKGSAFTSKPFVLASKVIGLTGIHSPWELQDPYAVDHLQCRADMTDFMQCRDCKAIFSPIALHHYTSLSLSECKAKQALYRKINSFGNSGGWRTHTSCILFHSTSPSNWEENTSLSTSEYPELIKQILSRVWS